VEEDASSEVVQLYCLKYSIQTEDISELCSFISWRRQRKMVPALPVGGTGVKYDGGFQYILKY
jgi:hypothetical protein